MIARPESSEYPAYFATYIAHVPEGEILELMDRQTEEIAGFFGGLTGQQADFRYAPDKLA
ncbi:MAG: hypothetical protein FJY97_14020 [candidate division Zixibacteria bacterium]|nr:hypothetical protein [candidate division Zixibacteria bacterium]